MEDVGVMAFSGCTGLKEIVVADGNEYFTVHEGALFDKNLEVLYCYPAAQTETSYTVPDSTLVIGPSAFMCAASLTQVTLPEKLRYIGDGAFYGCVGLSSIILPEAVTTIGDNAFDSCSALQTVTFVGADAEEQTGEDLSIGSYAFFACRNCWMLRCRSEFPASVPMHLAVRKRRILPIPPTQPGMRLP